MRQNLRAQNARKQLVRWIGVVTVFAIVGSAAATLYGRAAMRNYGWSADAAWRKSLWRTQLFALKAKGDVPTLSWRELWDMSWHRGGFGMERVPREGISLDGSVHNPYISKEDNEAGAKIFHQYCAPCHGGDGSGWHAAPLNRSGLKHGDTDLSIYQVLRDGVPGTAMPAAPVSVQQRWQLVGYIRMLQLKAADDKTDDKSTRFALNVTPDQILAAGTRQDEWLTYSGSLDGHRYTPLNEITPANASQLRIRWVHELESNGPMESTPLVISGVLFFSEPPSDVVAVEARTGKTLWRYDRKLPDDGPYCCGRVNRGLAVLGHTLFLESLDGYLVALNANTGEKMWEVQVARPSDGYSLTGAPLIVGRSVIVGVAGGEFGTRGFLNAYDSESGRQIWRFDTIPGPGEPGHETWQNDAWRSGGGGTWVTGSYDQALDLLYWGVGNPGPDFIGEVRPGDNLYTNSVIALHASTGKLAWHFQFTPHDDHDWDSNQTPILADIPVGNTMRKVICWANRNGFYYVLDRVTGEYLTGKSFVDLNWATGLDTRGRPILSDEGDEVSNTGRLTRPGVGGGTNWQNPAYDPKKGLIFVHATESASVFTKADVPQRGHMGIYAGSAGSQTTPPIPVVRALDAATGLMKWERYSPRIEYTHGFGGLLATGGGLVFGSSGGSVFADNSANGQQVWSVSLGTDTRAAPISFTLDGRQVILVSTSRAMFLFGL
jgi:alcohol dehydrogenase (cytochrome c)